MFKEKKRYLVQWENGIWKSWWTERNTKFAWIAKRHALKMLARNSNVAAWRVVEINSTGKNNRIIFEGYIDRKWRDVEPGHIDNFSEEDIKKYYKSPIIIDGSKK
jgi:hypothetical protein